MRRFSLYYKRFIYGGSNGSVPASVIERKKFTVLDLARKKAKGIPTTMVTCYDASSAQHVEAAGIDIALVGDSAANVIQGKKSTTTMSMEQMLVHCESVARQCNSTFVVGDLPFGSYVTSEVGVQNAVLLVKAGCDAVKLEGGRRMAPVIRSIKTCGITVIGHCGVTPQTAAEQGGFKTQGRDTHSAMELIEDCLAVEEAGASAIVLEMVVDEVARLISSMLKIPTIGIGSGSGCDGQVLVYHDLLGLLKGGHNPKFAKQYANLGETATKALRDFGREVLSREFPRKQHSFLAPTDLMDGLTHELKEKNLLPAMAVKRKDPLAIQRVCVIGGGAMGSLFSHLLGHKAQVVMLSSHDEHVRAIRENKGLKIESETMGKDQNVVSPVIAASSVEQVKAAFAGQEPDIVVILVKSRDTPRAAKQAAMLLGESTIVLSLQNGIGHAESIYAACGKHRTILGTTSMAATLSESLGTVVHNGSGPTTLSPAGWSLMSQMSSVDIEKGKHVARRCMDLFQAAGMDVKIAADDQDMNNTVFAKLLINSVVNPLTALFQVRNGILLETKFRPICEGLAAESSCVLRCATGFTMADPVGEVSQVLERTSRNQSSMLSDVMRGVPTEIDVLNGTIVKFARQIGAQAPLNRSMLARVSSLMKKRTFSSSASAVLLADSVEKMISLRNKDLKGKTIGIVPTMGGLHQGHLLLAEHSAMNNDVTVVTIYVNPTQFGPKEDFNKYPRNLEGDLDLIRNYSALKNRNVVVFAPSGSIYDANHMTWVEPLGLEDNGEGLCRPGHFRGVATVVLKLFNIVGADQCYFGQKDGQQCIVVKSLVRDLNLPIRVNIIPTVRAADGLALSTRNQYLHPEQRKIAPALYAALCKAKEACHVGALPEVVKAAFVSNIPTPALTVQYISVASNVTGKELTDKAPLERGEVLLSAAVQFPGFPLRLIDNLVVQVG